MLNGYNSIATIYDLLAKLLFGGRIWESQLHFLNTIQGKENILILGGGTGWILIEILKRHASCRIWYIDASSKMIAMSRVSVNNDKRVHFIHGTEDDIPASTKFDRVITNFYIDMFSEISLRKAIAKIQLSLNPNADWIVTDFVTDHWWQKMLLKVMYLFFRITTNVETMNLPNWERAIHESGFTEKSSKHFCRDFIKATLYTSKQS